jgi:hypothetical protein
LEISFSGTAGLRIELQLAPPARRETDEAPKNPAKMRLIAHSASEGDLTERLVCHQHLILRGDEPSAGDVNADGHAESHFEGAHQVPMTQAGLPGEVDNQDPLGEIFLDVGKDTVGTPRGERAGFSLLVRHRPYLTPVFSA